MAKDDRKARILERAEREKVRFMRLQFTDILGATKNVEVPDRQFPDALDGRIWFDGELIRKDQDLAQEMRALTTTSCGWCRSRPSSSCPR